MKRKILFFILLFSFQENIFSQSAELVLNSSWQFRKQGDEKWMNATVPGTVHTDLLNNKIIDDPYYADNEKRLQWIDTCNWEYQTFFDCNENIFNQKHIELNFEGLDTYAKVFLNDSLILSASNMFRTWNVNCKNILKAGKNKLNILFESAIKKGTVEAKKLSYTLPGDEKVFTRKAAYHYGWDWGPRFVTCGIWRNVKLTSWSEATIKSVHLIQSLLNDTLAILTATIEVQSDQSRNLLFQVNDLSSGKMMAARIKKVSAGNNLIELQFDIPNPMRWWCNGLGNPFLYHFIFSIGEGRNSFDAHDVEVGLRTIELMQEENTNGKNFYFKLNGIPVFMKGANYIPPDNFLPRVTEERYQEIIQNAVDANMNMLRVWGGGVYEDDKFYELCDEKGILVWQDFMFACAMYPADSAFTNNVREEIIDNVKRLRNHPSIALWCGNNEIDEGWNNWGWQKQYGYSSTDSLKIWNDYLKIFRQLIPGVISEYDGSRSYWESSPAFGWGHKESLYLLGDSHYWGVWWGMEPFDIYKKKVGRFMSEYGFQSMPRLSTFKTICDEKDLSLTSTAVKNHQKHPKGFETIQTYLDRDYNQPIRDSTSGANNFENYIYVSQLLQAEGIKTAIEAHRRAKPYCMGSLYWQLNDCWPVTSWSSTDYYGNWKALHYFVKKSFENILVSVTDEKDSVEVYVVSDVQEELPCTLKLSVNDFSGIQLWKKELPIVVDANSGRIFLTVSKKDLGITGKQNNAVLTAQLTYNENLLSDNYFYFAKAKDLELALPTVKISLVALTLESTLIQVETNTLAKNIFLDLPDCKNCFSENFFDLLPNQVKIIVIKGKVLEEGELRSIHVKSLADTY